MNPTSPPEPVSTPFPTRVAHLLILWGLAVAQPLFNLLGGQPAFLLAHGTLGWQVVAWAGLLALAAPLLLATLLQALGHWSPRLAERAFGALLYLLLVSILLTGLNLLTGLPGWLNLVAALAGGWLLRAFYRRQSTARLFLTYFAVAALVFPAHFLWFSGAATLVRETGAAASDDGTLRHRADIPVIVLVLDEFPLLSLLDGSQQIDAQRFPNFARLAGTAHWYRNATSVAESTMYATAAITSGLAPRAGASALPLYRNFPDTVFTLLNREVPVVAHETGTRLCPPTRCEAGAGASTSWQQLFADTAVAYAHLWLPAQWRLHLPPINQNWQGFLERAGQADGADIVQPDAAQLHREFRWHTRGSEFMAFLDQFDGRQPGGVYYFHSLLPHAPWVMLPDGRNYAFAERSGGVFGVRLNRDTRFPSSQWGRWIDSEAMTRLAQQRHLLQVGAVDRLLGLLMDRLRALGMFERSLLIVTGDHGASFMPRQGRRMLTEHNLAEIANVPLFIKYPQQTRGSVDDRAALPMDLLPTIAEVLEVEPPPRTDGLSLLQPDPGRQGPFEVIRDSGQRVQYALSELLSSRQAAHATLLERFGSGGLDTLASASDPALQDLGEEDFPSLGSEHGLELEDAHLYRDIRPDSAFLPVLVRGNITRDAGGPEFEQLAVFLNGRLVTTTGLLTDEDTPWDFMALLPPSRLQPGFNSLRVHGLQRPPGQTPILVQLLAADMETFAAQVRDGRVQAFTRDGRALTADRACGDGFVRADYEAEYGQLRISGWAADRCSGAPARAFFVFLDGQPLLTAAPNRARPDVVQRTGFESARQSGFSVVLPHGDSAALSDRSLTVVAELPGDRFHEPGYRRDTGWPFRGPTRAAGPTADRTPAPAVALVPGRPYDFGKHGDATPFRGSGWSAANASGLRWNRQRTADLEFTVPETGHAMVLVLQAYPFLHPAGPTRQRIVYRAGAQAVTEEVLTERGLHLLELPLPEGAADADGNVRITFEFPDAMVPSELGISDDRRPLAIGIGRARVLIRAPE